MLGDERSYLLDAAPLLQWLGPAALGQPILKASRHAYIGLALHPRENAHCDGQLASGSNQGEPACNPSHLSVGLWAVFPRPCVHGLSNHFPSALQVLRETFEIKPRSMPIVLCRRGVEHIGEILWSVVAVQVLKKSETSACI